jgi:hypothetical protein
MPKRISLDLNFGLREEARCADAGIAPCRMGYNREPVSEVKGSPTYAGDRRARIRSPQSALPPCLRGAAAVWGFGKTGLAATCQKNREKGQTRELHHQHISSSYEFLLPVWMFVCARDNTSSGPLAPSLRQQIPPPATAAVAAAAAAAATVDRRASPGMASSSWDA